MVLTPLSTDADSLPFLSSRFASLETRNRCNNNHQRSFLIETDAVQIHKSYSGCYMPWFDFSSASVSYYLLIYLLTNVDVNVIDVDIPHWPPSEQCLRGAVICNETPTRWIRSVFSAV